MLVISFLGQLLGLIQVSLQVDLLDALIEGQSCWRAQYLKFVSIVRNLDNM